MGSSTCGPLINGDCFKPSLGLLPEWIVGLFRGHLMTRLGYLPEGPGPPPPGGCPAAVGVGQKGLPRNRMLVANVLPDVGPLMAPLRTHRAVELRLLAAFVALVRVQRRRLAISSPAFVAPGELDPAQVQRVPRVFAQLEIHRSIVIRYWHPHLIGIF